MITYQVIKAIPYEQAEFKIHIKKIKTIRNYRRKIEPTQDQNIYYY